jgi:hypothetical protein
MAQELPLPYREYLDLKFARLDKRLQELECSLRISTKPDAAGLDMHPETEHEIFEVRAKLAAIRELSHMK